MKNIYIFDLDDTLVDSRIRFEKGLFSVLEEEGIAYDAREMITVTTPLGLSGSAKYFREVMGIQDTEEHILYRIEQSMYALYARDILPKAGVVSYLQKLQGIGARLFVLTATPHSLTDICLERNGLFSYFEQVWSTDDFGLPKTDIRLFYRVAKALDTQPADIRYFDDSLTALKNAKAVGFETYAVYNEHTEQEIKYMKEHYNGFVRSFSEMTD